MKNHGIFTQELHTHFPNTAPELLAKVVALSRMGLAPEGLGTDEKNKIVDAIYASPTGRLYAMLATPTVVVPSGGARKPYRHGAKSNERLKTLYPPLRECVELAITISIQDWVVLETDRTLATQKQYLAKGSTRTLKSKHLLQPDGFAHAVDLGAWDGEKVIWGFDDYFEIAQAVDQAASRLGIAGHVRWGAVWDRVLDDFGGLTKADYVKAVDEYKVRHKGPDFLDGPHYEWVA